LHPQLAEPHRHQFNDLVAEREGLGVVDDSGASGAGSVIAVLFPLDALVNLFTMNRDVFGGIDTDPYLVSLYAQNGDRNFVSDHYGFTNSSRQYQHK
jgi:hypothetical protein